jgi:hypothetical protein
MTAPLADFTISIRVIALTPRDSARITAIARRLHEHPSEDSANCNELLEVLYMLGAVDSDGNPIAPAPAEIDR